MIYPRLYVTQPIHERAKRMAKKAKTTLKKMSERIAKAGIKVVSAEL